MLTFDLIRVSFILYKELKPKILKYRSC